MSSQPEQPSAGPDIRATLLLCDAAQSINGKLYILGGGWTQGLQMPGAPTNVALAVRLLVPWDMANQKIPVEARLVTDTGEVVVGPQGPIRAGGDLEVARGLGLRQGIDLDSAFVLDFGGLDLPSGGYVFELRVRGEVKAREVFTLRSMQQGGA